MAWHSLHICISTWETGCTLCYPTFPDCQYPTEFYGEIWQTSTPTKLLTAFKIITFSPLWFQAKITASSSLFNQSQKPSALCSTNHTTVGHESFDQSIHLHFLLMSSTLPKPRMDRPNKKGGQISNRKTHAHAEKVFHYFQKDCQGFSQGAHDPCFISSPFSLIFLFFHK